MLTKSMGASKGDCISGLIERAYICDYESNVPPEYTKDGKAHCYLYISVK